MSTYSTVYLLGTSSHGYVKDILRVLGYNNFFTNIRIALFNMTNIYVNISLGDRQIFTHFKALIKRFIVFISTSDFF